MYHTRLLHGLGLGSGAYTGHGQTHVDGGSDTLVEQLSLQEDLAVSDGDHVGGNVSGHVAGLRLDDGQRGEGAAAHLVRPGIRQIYEIDSKSLTL